MLRGEGLDETEDLSDIGDDELLQIIPDMAMALATKGMILQRSAFCMTVRGAVRFNEEARVPRVHALFSKPPQFVHTTQNPPS